MELDEFRLDRTAVRITTQEQEPPAYEYWLQQTAEKRLSAIEFLRRQYAGTERRLQRVYRITQRQRG